MACRARAIRGSSAEASHRPEPAGCCSTHIRTAVTAIVVAIRLQITVSPLRTRPPTVLHPHSIPRTSVAMPGSAGPNARATSAGGSMPSSRGRAGAPANTTAVRSAPSSPRNVRSPGRGTRTRSPAATAVQQPVVVRTEARPSCRKTNPAASRSSVAVAPSVTRDRRDRCSSHSMPASIRSRRVSIASGRGAVTPGSAAGRVAVFRRPRPSTPSGGRPHPLRRVWGPVRGCGPWAPRSRSTPRRPGCASRRGCRRPSSPPSAAAGCW